jgi:hypothetical protein
MLPVLTGYCRFLPVQKKASHRGLRAHGEKKTGTQILMMVMIAYDLLYKDVPLLQAV